MLSRYHIYLILFFIFHGKFILANDITSLTGFETSLERFNRYQSQDQCEQKTPSTCPVVIEKLVEDDFQDRAIVIKSRAASCLNRNPKLLSINPSEIQKFSQAGRFEYLGDYSHSTIRACLTRANSRSNDLISKFYYYNTRLNEGGSKVIQERILISKLLNQNPPMCPPQDIMNVAYKVCQQSKACPNTLSLKELSSSAKNDQDLYQEILLKLKSLPSNCEQDEKCRQERAAWSATTLGLLKRNPWFVNDEFMKQKSKLSTEERLKNYLIMTDKNLASLQQDLGKTAACIHGSNAKDCDLDKIREVLSLTPELPEVYTKNKTENNITSLMTEQACLEEASIDRNRTGKVMTDTYLNIGLTIGTLGIGALANTARLAALGSHARSVRLISESLNLSFDIYAAALTAKETMASCASDNLKFDFKNLSDIEVCESKGQALSSATRENGSCLVNAGLTAVSALIIIPGGSRIAKLIQESGYLRTIPKSTTSVVVVDKIRALPNVPKTIKVETIVKPDGKKSTFYSYAEKLPKGTWVRSTKELPIDGISGGINASYPAGRELFEKIIQEKSGQAYFAFIDVGSLGAVNKTFKAGDEAGDRYLKSIADKIIENGEGKVTLARLGGDEYGLIIDETDPKKVKALLEKIQSSIRSDLKGEAKLVFREEKIVRAERYRLAANKLRKEKGRDLTTEEILKLRRQIDEIAKIQQPDISVGATQIGKKDDLESLLVRSEEQAKEMKIQTALNSGRSAQKYGSEAVPRSRPDPMFKAPISEPTRSSSWSTSGLPDVVPDINTLRDLRVTKKEELNRFSNTAIARYEDEAGRSSYRVERFTTDAITGERKVVTTDVPTRGTTGLLDGTHPESHHVISDMLSQSEDTVLIMPKLKNLKYVNYFENGTKAGDEMLEAVSETIKSNMRSSDMAFKLNGADFLWSTKGVSSSDLQKIEKRLNSEILNSPKVRQLLEKERLALDAKIGAASNLGDTQAVAKLKEKRETLKDFKPDLGFKTISKQEAEKAGNFQKVLKLFDEKFKD